MIYKNDIKTNLNGIEVISADPLIFNNKIDKNFENGIITLSHKDLRFEIIIKN